MLGVVIRSTGSFYEVEGKDNKIYTCRLKGRFRLQNKKETNPIAVGDKVNIELDHRGEDWMITEIKDRKNYIVRESNNLSKSYHVIAANLDRLLVIATIAQPRTSLGFIDRILVTAEMYGIDPIIIFNKFDLYNEEEKSILEEYIGIYSQIGYPCKVISAKNPADIEALRNDLEQSVSVIAGHSGVGKTTILNALVPGLDRKTSEISEHTGKGTHTTTFAEMYRGEKGMKLIDTPGIKDFGLVFIAPEELSGYFPEIRSASQACKFNNCIHVNEPKCEVKNQVINGLISHHRYENYLMMLADLKIQTPRN